ncbi:MAG: di-heme oxidoredictase family protein [Pseudomonadota bacterium]|nr:di-heme oxidoredictase family protein [Pseudomonadota bacterium]MEC8282481.1 di-heme oxidoredictase family protein [Pseudomonadota bacterium]MEC9177474.1 di-heme oxidoredictase family protein [Pseudomonadota bacterium]
MLEAILWHGGEAIAARTTVTDLPTAERVRLLAFLASL